MFMAIGVDSRAAGKPFDIAGHAPPLIDAGESEAFVLHDHAARPHIEAEVAV